MHKFCPPKKKEEYSYSPINWCAFTAILFVTDRIMFLIRFHEHHLLPLPLHPHSTAMNPFKSSNCLLFIGKIYLKLHFYSAASVAVPNGILQQSVVAGTGAHNEPTEHTHFNNFDAHLMEVNSFILFFAI